MQRHKTAYYILNISTCLNKLLPLSLAKLFNKYLIWYKTSTEEILIIKMLNTQSNGLNM